MRNAKSASTRLASSTDDDFERAVKKIFKVDRSDDRFKKIKEPFDDILSWTEVPQKATKFDTLKPADVRIFCDNDAIKEGRDPKDVNGPGRWRKLVGKVEGNDRYMDDKNHMQFLGKPWCQDMSAIGGGNCKGHTDFDRFAPASQFQRDGTTPNLQYGQNEKRVVVSLCDYVFKERFDIGSLFDLHPEEVILTEDKLDWDNKDWSKSDMEKFESIIAHTILHELIHASRPDIKIEDPNNLGQWISDPLNPGIGDYPDINNAYNWHSIKKMDFDTAIKNADSYAELGLLAMLADKGYTLQRAVPNMELDEQNRADQVKHDEDAATDGYIRKYPDITKQALRMIARWFMA